MEDVQKKYPIKPFKEKSGKQRKLLLEEIDTSLYKPTARCVAFCTTEDKILFWIKAFQDYSFEPLCDNDKYHIKCIDHLNYDDTAFEYIELKISRLTEANRTLEFPLIKQRVEEIYSSYQTASTGKYQSVLSNQTNIELNANLEAYRLEQSTKKDKATKTPANATIGGEANLDAPTEENANNPPLPATPKVIHRKRRNFLDSPKGLPLKSTTFHADLKSVVSVLESDVIEIKNSLLAQPEENARIIHLEDKFVQLENSLKAQIVQLTSRVTDLELDNDLLRQENSKVKNDLQSLKEQLKAMDKKIPTLPNVESDHQKITDEDVRQSGNNADHKEVTDQRMALGNNPFHLLSDHGNEDNSSTILSDTLQHPIPRDHIHTLNEKSLPPKQIKISRKTHVTAVNVHLLHH